MVPRLAHTLLRGLGGLQQRDIRESNPSNLVGSQRHCHYANIPCALFARAKSIPVGRRYWFMLLRELTNTLSIRYSLAITGRHMILSSLVLSSPSRRLLHNELLIDHVFLIVSYLSTP